MAVLLDGTITDTEGKATGNTVNVATGQLNPISSTSLSSTNPLNLPSFNQQTPEELAKTTASVPSLDSIISSFSSPTPQEDTQKDFRTQIIESLNKLSTEKQRTIEEEEARGIPQLQKDVEDASARLTALQNEALAIPLQIQEEFTGRGVTQAGVEPIQTARLRQNAIQALSVSAIARAKVGQLELAQQQVDRAIDLEFAPEEARLTFLKQAYEFNREDLEREDKKRSERLNIFLNERERLLTNQKEERKSVQNILLTASEYGAPTEALEKIRGARTVEEAVLAAGPYMRDPAAKQALLNAQLDYKLKGLQIKEAQQKIDLLNRYGGLTPEEWDKKQEEEAARLSATEKEARKINEGLTSVDIILGSNALSSVVGANPLSRGVFRQGGGLSGYFGGVVSAAKSGLTFGFGSGLGQEVSGTADQIVSLTSQITDQLFLDKLIESKGQGATFGALTNREGDSIRSAATAIQNARICGGPGGICNDQYTKTIAYDMSEAEFKRQIGIIADAMRYNYEDITGQVLAEDEEALFEEMQAGINSDPLDWYNN